MDTIQKRLEDMRDELFDLSNTKNDDDFERLLKIKNVNEDLYLTLVLLHNNYKAEFNMLKTGHVTTITKLINYQMEIVNINKQLIKDVETLKTTNTGISGVLKPRNLALILSTVFLFIAGIWSLFSIDGNAGSLAAETIKSIFSRF